MEKAQKTLVAVPSAMEWRVLFPRSPFSRTISDPLPLSSGFDAACLGIGLVVFGGNLAKLLCTNHYSRILVLGIAGALPQSGLSSGNIVRVDEECVGDEGYWNADKFTPYFARPHIIRATPSKFAPAEIASLSGVRGVSVNTLTASPSALECRARFFKAKVEAMEGASAFAVANAFGVRIFEVRTVSNVTGDLDETRWNLRESLAAVKRQILDSLVEAGKR